MTISVGVLDLQGAVSEHLRSLEKGGARAVAVKRPRDLEELRGLIIPGGESTTIGGLMREFGLDEAIIRCHREGMALFGTCAGMILLAKDISDGLEGQFTLGLMDITVRRNAFGRQKESFESDLALAGFNAPVRAVFIRAPIITAAEPAVEVLGRLQEGAVAARQGKLFATAFHPELTEDPRVHRYFIEMCRQ